MKHHVHTLASVCYDGLLYALHLHKMQTNSLINLYETTDSLSQKMQSAYAQSKDFTTTPIQCPCRKRKQLINRINKFE